MHATFFILFISKTAYVSNFNTKKEICFHTLLSLKNKEV